MEIFLSSVEDYRRKVNILHEHCDAIGRNIDDIELSWGGNFLIGKNEKELTKKAVAMRRDVIRMLELAGSGHPGGSLSSTDILTCLFFNVLRHNSKQPDWPDRDRFHMSKGHCCPIWYALLADFGYFDKKELDSLRSLGALLQGHPDPNVPGIDVASGSLGQGLSVSMGMALAGKMDKRDYRVYCLLGDGESQEGNVWEAAMASAHFKCDNLCAMLDYNGYQIDGRVDEVTIRLFNHRGAPRTCVSVRNGESDQ